MFETSTHDFAKLGAGLPACLIARLLACVLGLGLLWAPAARSATDTLLFENLEKLGNSSSYSIKKDTGTAQASTDGPKGLASADLDGDGLPDLIAANTDGSIAVLFGKAGGGFEPAIYLAAGNDFGLRDVIAANVLGDNRPEIIAAHPFEGKLFIFSVSGAAGSRTFSSALTVNTWLGARCVTAGDFDGDGKLDLAVGGAGLGFREYRNNGSGKFTAIVTSPSIAIDAGPFQGNSAQPVFSMQAWRRPGETRDRLVVSFTEASQIWFLGSPGPGQALQLMATTPLMLNEKVYDIAVGFVSSESRASGEPDILTAVQWSGEIFVRRYVAATATLNSRYPLAPQQRLSVPGGPRAISLSDYNNDSWPDLLVVTRTSNALYLYTNKTGLLVLASLSPAGSSPRDVTRIDLDGNGFPDAAVINRDSGDITTHRIDPQSGMFFQSPLVRAIPGGASVVSIQDVDGDGPNELIYLSPATGDVCIQKVAPLSYLLPPVRYFMGARPQALSVADLNNDGLKDLLCTSLGNELLAGGLGYRLQLPNHTFGPLMQVSIPAGAGTAMFAQIMRDFNGDGYMDLVVGYFDFRVAFFEGTATGLVHRRTEQFTYNACAMAAADFDHDGDLDLAGIGAYGDLVIVENNGGWFNGGAYRTKTFAAGNVSPGVYGLEVKDLNNDGYLDLTVLSHNGVTRWTGSAGLAFANAGATALPNTLASTEFDFDRDGVADRFELVPDNTTLSFSNGAGALKSSASRVFRVPSAGHLAFGDLDGDGKPDLVGVGEFLWTALSGTVAPTPIPTARQQPPVEVAAVVINEVLAVTSDFIGPNATRPIDYVEIFNGTAAPVNLAGWRLRCVASPEAGVPNDFVFPAFVLPPGALVLVNCVNSTGDWNAPFKLPADGASLRLLNAAGATSDFVAYPPQQPDISYARLSDGSSAFVYNPFPSLGSTNYDNGNTQPEIVFKGVDTALLATGIWRFRARVWSITGLFTLTVSWREITTSGTARTGVIALFDDGAHDDNGSFDGIFAGDWQTPLPRGTPIEFFITGTDLRGESTTEPKGPEFTAAGASIENYTLSLPSTPSGWEISEVVPRNRTGLLDELGRNSDWIELRYTGAGSITATGLYLSDSLFGYNPLYLYDTSRLVSATTAGSSKIVFLDGMPFTPSMPAHAPFGVDGTDGDSIFLIRRLPSGATEFIDAVHVPALPVDTAYARQGVGGPFVEMTPTPRRMNVLGSSVPLHLVASANGGKDVVFTFGGGGSVEASSDMKTWTTVLPWVSNYGIERVYREKVQGAQRFFRVR